MRNFFQIEVSDIRHLDGGQLQELLNRLLHAKALQSGLPLGGLHTTSPTRINVPDGGRDALIEWNGGPVRTDFLPCRVVALQSKATRMGAAACQSEVFEEGVIKPGIRYALDK